MLGLYLRLRGGTYHCRIRLPAHLRRIVRRGEMTVSLGTGHRRTAVRAAREIRTGMDRIMSAIDKGLPGDLIERQVRAWVARSAMTYDQNLADGMTGILTADEMSTMGAESAQEFDALFKIIEVDQIASLRRKLARAAAGIESDDAGVKHILERAASEVGAACAQDPLKSKLFRRSVLRNMAVYLDSAEASLLGRPLPDQVTDWAARFHDSGPTNAPPAPENAHVTMSELWERFSRSKVGDGAWKTSEIVAARSTLRLWIRIEDDKPVGSYTSEHVEDFREVFRSLPADYYHNKDWRSVYDEKGPRAVVAASSKVTCERAGAKTFNKHLARLNEFWKWAASGKGLALPIGTPSICNDCFVTIPVDNASDAVKNSNRRRYTDKEIGRLFSSPTYLGSSSRRLWKKQGLLVFRDHRYWLPIIAFLHGMRREEPLVLLVRHVRQTPDGVWYFDLWDKSVRPLLKDVGSPRFIPLHKFLLELGFLEARVVGRPLDSRLFPEAISHSEIGRLGQPFGQWFRAFRRFHGVIDQETDFHSIRHTVINLLLDAGVPKSHVEELVGHESQERRSELATYDHGRLVGLLKEGIDRLVIPLDIASMRQAICISDGENRSAAWPSLEDGTSIPRPKKSTGPKTRIPFEGEVQQGIRS